MSLNRRAAAWIAVALVSVLVLAAFAAEPALAQARNPFSVGLSEGGGSATGVTGWLLAQQGWLEHQLAIGVRAAKIGTANLWPLVAMSLLYGVFHAAGPGHGKAVLASYMVANERALRRGVALSFAAAALQGCVAMLLIAVLTLLLHATAQHVKAAASWVETASFLTVAGLGLQLAWRKGKALLASWRVSRRDPVWSCGRAGLFPASAPACLVATGVGSLAFAMPQAVPSRFACEAAHALDDAACLHCLGADPRALGSERVDWRQAGMTVLAAGLRPCSGAILVLVFAVAQGFFLAGALSVAAMSLGVAVTTSALATGAVLFKGAVSRLAGRHSPRAALVGAAVEFAAACVVLAAGLLLLTGYALTSMS